MKALKAEGWKWVWLGLLLADVFWELTGYFIHNDSWDHETLSQIVKRWEGIDPATGKPLDTPLGLVKRGVVLLALIAACVALVLHWVFQVF